MTLSDLIVTVLSNAWEWDCMNCSQINVLKPSLDSVLIIVKPDGSVWGTNHQKPTLNFENRNSWWWIDLFHLIDLVWIVHQVDCLDGPSFFRLSVIFHDQTDVPHNDHTLLGSWNCLGRVRDEHSLSEGFFGRNFGWIQFETSLSVLPEPEKDSGFTSCGKLSFVVVKLDEFLHTVDFLVHLCRDVTRVFFFPFPKSDYLLGGGGSFAEGNDEGSIFVNVKR